VFPATSSHATSVVETVGMFLFALYHVSTIIVLINTHCTTRQDLLRVLAGAYVAKKSGIDGV